VIIICLLQLHGSVDSQFRDLQAEFDRLHGAWEEESEAAATLRAQLQKLQADYLQLKGKYDKDVGSRTEELEEIR